MPETPPVPEAPADRIRIKRIYRAARVSDGRRILVDRLWPRGIARDRARLSEWCKDIAPSDALRRQFHADPEAWEDFRARYLAELDRHDDILRQIADYAREGVVTLLYAAKDETRNNAAVLRDHLVARLFQKRPNDV
jgi:uncharacterized protein YeaO (DUF488 family)